MTITRAQLEKELVSRTQGYLENVEMEVTSEGANADLNGPIGFSVRQCGGTVSNPILVADADLATFADSDFDKLADYAELRLLMNIKRRWGKVDMRAEGLAENLSQFAEQLDVDIENLKESIASDYVGLGSLSAGNITLNFAQKGDDEQ